MNDLAERCEAATGPDHLDFEIVRKVDQHMRAEFIARLAPACDGWVRRRFNIRRFQDGENIGLPQWAKHLVIGGFCEQGWAAYDQRRKGQKVAHGKWGEPIMLLSGGRITCKADRLLLKALRARSGGQS